MCAEHGYEDKGATFKSMEGPAAHPPNRDRSKSKMAKCVGKW